MCHFSNLFDFSYIFSSLRRRKDTDFISKKHDRYINLSYEFKDD
ncbi:hypothetical protein BACCOPRO_03237 [Phocaeicola coprophilus DSM 18228 = JCM 13818]|uniref:Uncharacterized protein n=1 Tax=Phocaeicola coprophilus DSM 18228 = JCM 13818 TaxID=547042 RepID=S0FBP9_9BACT|nr:hypothetical protein BACCOPRO_03237 [Phocaeicola coprophilus DSM 18228 = JCM 13818]